MSSSQVRCLIIPFLFHYVSLENRAWKKNDLSLIFFKSLSMKLDKISREEAVSCRAKCSHIFFSKTYCYDAALLKNVYHANCTKNSAGHLSKSSLSKLHFPMLFSISDSALTQLFFCQPRSKKENLLRQAVQSWKAGVWHEISEAKDERKARKSDSLRTKQCLLKFDTPLSSSTSTAEFSRSIR